MNALDTSRSELSVGHTRSQAGGHTCCLAPGTADQYVRTSEALLSIHVKSIIPPQQRSASCMEFRPIISRVANLTPAARRPCYISIRHYGKYAPKKQEQQRVAAGPGNVQFISVR